MPDGSSGAVVELVASISVVVDATGGGIGAVAVVENDLITQVT